MTDLHTPANTTRRWTRRSFLAAALVTPAAGFAMRPRGLKIGVYDWKLGLPSKLEAVALAKRLNFDGVQVSLGHDIKNGKMTLDNPELIAAYRAGSHEQHIPFDGTSLNSVDCLAKGGAGPRRVADGIRITRMLGTRVMLVPFFGGCEITRRNVDAITVTLRELAPEAEKAHVILGLENTLSAEETVRIMDKTKSHAVLVYYDVGNAYTWFHNAVQEIHWLGKDRICQFHLKDGRYYLGEGPINFKKVLRAIISIGFNGFANLETESPSGNIDADMRRNLAFVRQTLKSLEAGGR